MFPVLLTLIFLGVPIAFALMSTAFIFGIIRFGENTFFVFMHKVDDITGASILAAVPLFIFMGNMLEKSGTAERLFEAIHLWTQRLPGGLAVGTIAMCVIFAACSGVIGATETVVGLLATPVMLKHGYDKGLISGTVTAGGSLGAIIPPSVVVIILAAVSEMSLGDMFIGMFIPGLLMAFLYVIYIIIRCYLDPSAGPRIPSANNIMTFRAKLKLTGVALLPPLILIVSVLGSIMMGIAVPTEAAAVGAIGTVILTIVYRTFTIAIMMEAMVKTIEVTAMILIIVVGGTMFASVFLSISSFVVTTCSTDPNNPSRTNLCVSVPSSVPVNPNLYLHWCNLVIIPVNDLDLNMCASSPITHPNASKYFLGNLYKDCHVDITTSLVTLRS